MKDFAVISVANNRNSDLNIEVLIADIIDDRIYFLFASFDPRMH